MLPARLDDRYADRDPHAYGFAQAAMNRRPTGLSTSLVRPRDAGAEGESWRNILLDQLRGRRGLLGGSLSMADPPVYKPKHKVPGGYADNLGGGKPGPAVVQPDPHHHPGPPVRHLGGPQRQQQGGQAEHPGHPGEDPVGDGPSDKLANTGSAAGKSGKAYDARPRQRKVVRSQVAG